MARSPQSYLVSAIRRIWRWSPERRKCIAEAEVCYVCKEPFKVAPKWSVRKQRGLTYTLTEDAVVMVEGPQKVCNKARKKLRMAWKKLYAPQADHVKPVGEAPKTWDGPWAAYLVKMFGNKLAAICRACHRKKTNEEAAARRERKKREKQK